MIENERNNAASWPPEYAAPTTALSTLVARLSIKANASIKADSRLPRLKVI